MKVGTDAVLLGAWVEAASPLTVLDIGTGCGLIALMLAQRFTHAQIDAIDIDEASIIEAKRNFLGSPWSERLNAVHAPLQSWVNASYDLIVSNPPYFANGYPIAHKSRALARSQEGLDFETLLLHVKRLLKPGGRFALVLPISTLSAFEKELDQAGLYCQRKTEVLSFEGKAGVLVLLEAGLERLPCRQDQLCIRDANGSYHAEYLSLTRDFYLFS